MKFDQFEIGQRLESGPRRLSQDEIIAFAQAYDPQWFHTDPGESRRGRFGGLIASGWHSCGIAMRLAVDAFLDGSESFASPGLEYLKWTAPVRPGDELTLRVEVLDKRRSEKNPELGILKWRWHLHNQDDVVVLELVATSLFDLAMGDET